MIRALLLFGHWTEEHCFEDVYPTSKGMHGIMADGRIVNFDDCEGLRAVCFLEGF
jgi:hypothetical protein